MSDRVEAALVNIAKRERAWEARQFMSDLCGRESGWALDVLRGDRESLQQHSPTPEVFPECPECSGDDAGGGWLVFWPCDVATRLLDRYAPDA